MRILQGHTVLQRLDRLEREVLRSQRENRCWRLFGGSIVFLLLVLAATGATTDRVADDIRARRFTLVNEEGKRSAALLVGPDGSPNLIFYDKAQQRRVTLGVSVGATVPLLAFFDQTGLVRGMLSMVRNTPLLALADSQGRQRLDLSVQPNGQSAVRLFDQAGVLRLQVVAGTARNDVGITLFDAAGAPRTYWGTAPTSRIPGR